MLQALAGDHPLIQDAGACGLRFLHVVDNPLCVYRSRTAPCRSLQRSSYARIAILRGNVVQKCPDEGQYA